MPSGSEIHISIKPQVAIYNPDIDKDGSNGRGLAAAIRSALAG